MKKTLLILLISFFSSQVFSQDPDPELFKTWYLTSIEVDLGDEIFVSNINPSISPTLTINEQLEFEGIGACNGFGGEFVFGEANGYDALTPTNFFGTLFICDYQEHTDFEGIYFDFFQFEEPLMIENIEPTHLALEGLAGFILHYSDEEQFSITDNQFYQATIYPNPTSGQLFISSENNSIHTVSIFSVLGKRIQKTTASSITSIDVSNLSKGIYFIEISSSEGNVVKKFMKN